MAATEVFKTTGLVKENGYRYYIAGEGNIMKQSRATKEKSVAMANVFVPEKGFFYFLDANGNVGRTVRVPRGKKPVVVPAQETTNVSTTA